MNTDIVSQLQTDRQQLEEMNVRHSFTSDLQTKKEVGTMYIHIYIVC